MRPIENARTVEVLIKDTTSSSFSFEKQDTMSDKRIIGVQAYSITDFAVGPESGNAMVNTTTFGKAFLIMQLNGSDRIHKLPLNALRRAFNNGELFECKWEHINWTQSKVYTANQAAQAANEVYAFTFYYEDLK